MWFYVFVGLCVCGSVCLLVCVYVGLCVYRSLCMWVCAFAGLRVCGSVCTCVWVYVDLVCKWVCVYVDLGDFVVGTVPRHRVRSTGLTVGEKELSLQEIRSGFEFVPGLFGIVLRGGYLYRVWPRIVLILIEFKFTVPE